MSKIAIAGDLKEVLPFKAAGFEVYPLDRLTEDKKMNHLITEILFEKKHEIVFISERYFTEFNRIYESQRVLQEQVPVITPVTDGVDFHNLGVKSLKGLIERAIGVDIFKE
ncbi:MAG: hypothetical protein JW827_07765 [Spirochaetes bacterium]|nr:hypothetical protein [Spirochaetota bacterium]